MKIKKEKFLIGALLTAASLGVAGSITGTYAWYSYNTKSPITYSGIATGDSEFLQVRSDVTGNEEWKTSLSRDEFMEGSSELECKDGINYAGNKLLPTSFDKSVSAYNTSGKSVKLFQESLFQGILVQGNPNYTTSGRTYTDDEGGEHYGFFRSKVSFRSINPASIQIDDDTGDVTYDEYYEKDIYLSDITCKCTSDGKDISDAVRVAITTASETSWWIIAPGLTKPTPTSSNIGSLDLYGDDYNFDGETEQGIYTYNSVSGGWDFKEELVYDFQADNLDSSKEQVRTITYGTEGATESFWYKDAVLSTFDNDGKLTKAGQSFGTTGDADNTFSLIIWVYLQGWATNCSDANINAEFDLGLTFQVERD